MVPHVVQEEMQAATEQQQTEEQGHQESNQLQMPSIVTMNLQLLSPTTRQKVLEQMILNQV